MNAAMRLGGNPHDKHHTANPTARRLRRGFLDVVCCEVLEHADATVRAVDVLAGLASPYLVASVQPIWHRLNMARGKHLGALGNTPGHINHWGRASFLERIARRFDVLQTRSPLPWTMVPCRLR